MTQHPWGNNQHGHRPANGANQGFGGHASHPGVPGNHPVEYYGPPEQHPYGPQYGYSHAGYSGGALLDKPISSRKFSTTLLLSSLLGLFGVHRLYLGRIPSGLTMGFLTVCGGGLMIAGAVSIFSMLGVHGPELSGMSQSDEGTAIVAMLLVFAGMFPLIAACIWSVVDTLMISSMNLKDAQGAVPVPEAMAAVVRGENVAVSDRSMLGIVALWLFLGWAGGHRFYAGKIGTGLGMLGLAGAGFVGSIVDAVMHCNIGPSGINSSPTPIMLSMLFALPWIGVSAWGLVDIVLIATGKFRDSHGRPVVMKS